MKQAKRSLRRLIIVGLGPGAWGDLTVAARETLEAASAVRFRTLRHPTVDALRERRPDLAISSFDDLYETADDWGTLYHTMAERLMSDAMQGETIYAVPGHPLVGEASVREARVLAEERGVTVQIVAGLSFIEPVLAAVGIDPVEQGVQIIDATDLAAMAPQEVAGVVSTLRPVVVPQIYNRRMAGATKLALLEIFPADWPVTLIQSAGLSTERRHEGPLGEIDHTEFADHLTTLAVPAVPHASLRVQRTPEALRYVVARLRAPDGCPWDRQQTHASLARYALEEAAEVADAIEEFVEDPAHLAEELGDLLLQVYLHAEIAQEEGAFALGDVLESITAKLIRRHPHVFGDVAVSGAEQVVRNWEAIKQSERTATGAAAFESRLRGVPRNGSSLANAHEMQRKAIKAGFDWPTIADWQAQLDSELHELAVAATPEAWLDELGDVLFTLVALARRHDLDAEAALRAANEKFRRRFRRMEALSREQGRDLADLDRAGQVALWREAKEGEDAASADE
jgi:tetrapyrrole methylase family protein/MazG family protein